MKDLLLWPVIATTSVYILSLCLILFGECSVLFSFYLKIYQTSQSTWEIYSSSQELFPDVKYDRKSDQEYIYQTLNGSKYFEIIQFSVHPPWNYEGSGQKWCGVVWCGDVFLSVCFGELRMCQVGHQW